MKPAGPKLTRREFLLAAPMPLAALLGGCSLSPGSGWWEALAWAERLDETLARPFRGRLAKTYPRTAASAEFPVRSLTLAGDYAASLANWRLRVDGLVERPASYTLAELARAFPKVTEATRHDCVEGWSAIAEWGGLRLADLLASVGPRPEARFVVCHAADYDEDTGKRYYGSLALPDARHPQTLLAYEMNGQPLPLRHGAPLRLKVPTQLGYKSTKFIWRISLTADLAGLAGGRGGYWEDAGYAHWAGV